MLADKNWIAKNINQAQKLIDGVKIYIPQKTETNQELTQNNSLNALKTSSNLTQLININTATAMVLDQLPGIGEVTTQKIVDHRPYKSIDELLNNKVVNKSVFEKIKDKITAF